jgi:O-antigen ligase
MTERVTRWWLSGPPIPATIVRVAMFAVPPLVGWSLAYALAYDRWDKWLAFSALVMIAVVPAVVRWPVILTFGLYAFVATSLDAFPFIPGGGAVSKPVGALAGAVLLGAGLVERRLARPPTAALWWIAFMLWGSLTVVWAVDLDVALLRLPTTLSLVVLYVAAVCFRPSRRELYWVCAMTVLGGVVAATLAYFFGLEEQAADQVARGRLALGGMDSNPNTLGRVLLLPLILAIAGFVAGRRILYRVLAIGCAGLIGLGIFISMSRSAVVAMAAMLLVLFYRTRRLWHLVAVVVLLLVVAALMPDAFYERFETLATGEDDGSGRLGIWRTGLQALERSGILGAGLHNFPVLHGAYVPGSRFVAHNSYLAILVEFGIPGIALMLAAIAGSFLAVQRIRKAGHGSIALSGLEAACIGMLASSMFGDTLWTKSFWLAWILLTWATYVEKQSRGPSEDALVPRDT